jgi:hypothetical protein
MMEIPDAPGFAKNIGENRKKDSLTCIDIKGYLWDSYFRNAYTQPDMNNPRVAGTMVPSPDYIGDQVVKQMALEVKKCVDLVMDGDTQSPDGFNRFLPRLPPSKCLYLSRNTANKNMPLMVFIGSLTTKEFPEGDRTIVGREAHGVTFGYSRGLGKFSYQWKQLKHSSAPEIQILLPFIFMNLKSEYRIVIHNEPRAATEVREKLDAPYVAKDFSNIEVVEVNAPTVEHIYPGADSKHASGWTQKGHWRLLRSAWDARIRNGLSRDDSLLRIIPAKGGGTIGDYHEKGKERQNLIDSVGKLHVIELALVSDVIPIGEVEEC